MDSVGNVGRFRIDAIFAGENDHPYASERGVALKTLGEARRGVFRQGKVNDHQVRQPARGLGHHRIRRTADVNRRSGVVQQPGDEGSNADIIVDQQNTPAEKWERRPIGRLDRRCGGRSRRRLPWPRSGIARPDGRVPCPR